MKDIETGVVEAVAKKDTVLLTGWLYFSLNLVMTRKTFGPSRPSSFLKVRGQPTGQCGTLLDSTDQQNLSLSLFL